MVSTAATFCCLLGGWFSSGSSERLRFSCAMADTFHGAGGRAVPFFVLNEKHSYVRGPGLPHLQQSSRLRKYSSRSLAGTPASAASLMAHLPALPYWLLGLVAFPSLVASVLTSFPFWAVSELPLVGPSLRLSSFHLSSFGAGAAERMVSLACLSTFFFSTCTPAR